MPPPGKRPAPTAREHATGQKVFGRYTLLKVLGRGGMGIVWLARDDELEHEVALKFLPDLVVLDRALLNELKNETRRSLDLTHKNIVRIYDFVHDEGSGCISMEYIDGDTLSNLRVLKEKKVFEPHELRDWTTQLCDALDYAHNHARIIHRDLKPANLMVNQKGDLKVADFGIARSLGDSISKLNMESGTSGTLVYMSPQQLEGERGSHLDDIYSLGATLYDLLTGKPPFYSGNIDRQIRERAAPSMAQRRKEFEIEPASLPAVWEEVVAACLQKDPARRPQSAVEVANRLQFSLPETSLAPAISAPRFSKRKALIAGAAALLLVVTAGFGLWTLRQWGSRFASPFGVAAVLEKSIAVLPFQNLSDDKENAFFADGIQDDLLTSLARIKDLKVIGRTSVMSYRNNAARKLREIGLELGVAAILEGSVRRAANRVLVNVQLIDTASERHIWSERYDRTLADSITLQGELATEIAIALAAKLSPDEKARIDAKPTENPDAYVLYLRGREYQMRPEVSQDNYLAAENFYKQAVALDPRFPLARARLAEMQLCLYGFFDPRPARLAEARSTAEEAVRLDPNCGQAHMALASCLQAAEESAEAMRREVAAAVRLLPNDGYIALAAAMFQGNMGWHDEAAASYERAIVLNPREGKVFYNYGVLLYDQEDLPRSRWASDRALELSPDSIYFRLFRARAEIEWTGEVGRGKAVLAALPAGKDPDGRVTAAHCTVAILERNFPEALRLLAACPHERIPFLAMGFGSMVPRSFVQGLVHFYAGDLQRAYATLDSARWMLEVEAHENVGQTEAHYHVALAYAAMGWKDAAKAEVARSDKQPDDWEMAALFAHLGDRDSGLPLLERVSPGKGPWFKNMLRLLPQWDSLCNDPRFQKLVAETPASASQK